MTKEIGFCLLILSLVLVCAATVGAALAPALIGAGLMAKGTIAALVAGSAAVGIVLTVAGMSMI